MKISDLKIKLFADGACLEDILELNKVPHIAGFTTNPTLMKKAGIEDYAGFAKKVLSKITDKPISFEVFADDFETMYKQALEINSWGKNLNVKIPVMNTKRQPSYDLIAKLTKEGVQLNVTAIFSMDQIRKTTEALAGTRGGIVSVFAGRIADTGLDPMPIMKEAVQIVESEKNAELLWASPRELLNIIQADQVGCHIITATPDILKKLESLGKDLEDFSQETVEMFYNDAKKAGYSI